MLFSQPRHVMPKVIMPMRWHQINGRFTHLPGDLDAQSPQTFHTISGIAFSNLKAISIACNIIWHARTVWQSRRRSNGRQSWPAIRLRPPQNQTQLLPVFCIRNVHDRQGFKDGVCGVFLFSRETELGGENRRVFRGSHLDVNMGGAGHVL